MRKQGEKQCVFGPSPFTPISVRALSSGWGRRGAIVGLLAMVLVFALFAAPGLASTRVTVAAVGDLLMHDSVFNSVKDSRGAYHFDPVFRYVAPYLAEADYTVANLETKFGGSGLGYSGYPRFNCPESLAGTLTRAGVDLLATANNHTMDMGWTGIVKTLEYTEAAGLAHVGTARSQAERDRVFIANVNGVKIAFLNYTESTNGIALPAGRPYAANVLGEAACLAEAGRAKKAGADLVFAVLHFGDEYQRSQNSRQQGIARRLLAGGVDAVIGSHPHVVQPIIRESVTVAGRTAGRYAVYSLGNFVSNQRDRYKDSGIIAYFDIEKTSTGTSVVGVRYLPVYVQKTYATGKAQFRILPVAPHITRTSDLGLSAAERGRMDQVWSELHQHLHRPAQGVEPYGTVPPVAYAKALEALRARGIMEGFRDGTLGGHLPVTRQQFAKLIALTLEIPVGLDDECRFPDVTKSETSLYPDNYVAAVAKLGIARGYSDGRFYPHNNIARAQVITMVVRAVRDLNADLLPAPSAGFVTSALAWRATFSPEHGENCRTAEYHGLLNGLPLSALDPWGNMTRGETAQVLVNLLHMLGR